MTDDSVTRLAREIATLFCFAVEEIPDTMEALESLLREAMEEHDRTWKQECQRGLIEAQNLAYTRAAEVARQWGKENDALFGDEIAAAIERLREETK